MLKWISFVWFRLDTLLSIKHGQIDTLPKWMLIIKSLSYPHTHARTHACTHACMHTHTHTFLLKILYQPFTGQYQKKHSPIHTHPDIQTSFINFHHILRTMIHSILLLQCACLTVLFHNLYPGPLWSPSWYGTLYFRH